MTWKRMKRLNGRDGSAGSYTSTYVLHKSRFNNFSNISGICVKIWMHYHGAQTNFLNNKLMLSKQSNEMLAYCCKSIIVASTLFFCASSDNTNGKSFLHKKHTYNNFVVDCFCVPFILRSVAELAVGAHTMYLTAIKATWQRDWICTDRVGHFMEAEVCNAYQPVDI